MKVIINKVSGAYWYQPSIFTSSKRKWVARPYKSLKKLFEVENFLDEDFILSINSDPDLKTFMWLCQSKQLPISFKKIDLQAIEEGGHLDFHVKGCKVTLRFDTKSLKALKKGILPFFGAQYFKENFKNNEIVVWRTGGWKVIAI